MSDDLLRRPVLELAELVRTGQVSARELVGASVDAATKDADGLNAFVVVDGERALADAAAVDERIASGGDPGPLAGIPLGVKDLEDAIGFRTTQGSLLHADDPPATSDSSLVARLRAAGCVVVGKTNTPEHGWKADTVNAVAGQTRNPWGTNRIAGGSSGGSAAAVAGGLVPLCTGSDGGGSIRIPSAVCGLSGLKPSLGRVPGGPDAPDWPDLSTKGVMAHRIRDVAAVLDIVIGPDPTDLRSLPLPDTPWRRSLDELGAPMRVAWSPTLGYANVDDEVLGVCQRAVDALAELGTDVEQVDVVYETDPIMSWLSLTTAYLSRTYADVRDTDRWADVDPGLARMIEWGSSRPVVDAIRGIDAGYELHRRLVDLFHRYSLLLTPVVVGQTPAVGHDGIVNGKETVNWVSMTYPFNLTRSPAGTVCAGLTVDGMPVGLQVVGPQHADVAVLRCLAVLEDALGLYSPS